MHNAHTPPMGDFGFITVMGSCSVVQCGIYIRTYLPYCDLLQHRHPRAAIAGEQVVFQDAVPTNTAELITGKKRDSLQEGGVAKRFMKMA